MEHLFLIFQVLFDVVVIILLAILISRRRLEKEDIDRVLAVEERIRVLLEDKAKEISAFHDMVAYERDRAIEELKKKELEIEKKLALLSDAVGRKEEEKRKKRDMVKHLLKKGKTPAEIASELDIPISEVKLIAELLQKV